MRVVMISSICFAWILDGKPERIGNNWYIVTKVVFVLYLAHFNAHNGIYVAFCKQMSSLNMLIKNRYYEYSLFIYLVVTADL